MTDEPTVPLSPSTVWRGTLPWPGIGSLAVAVLAVLLEVVAIAVSSHGAWTLGTVLAWVTVLLGALAVVLGVTALVRSRGRAYAIAGIVLAVLGDPLVLVGLFRLLGA